MKGCTQLMFSIMKNISWSFFCASYSSSTGDSPANTGHVENAYFVEAHILPAKTAQQDALMEI